MSDEYFFERYREFSLGSPAVSPKTYEWDDLLKVGPETWSTKFKLFKLLFDKIGAIAMLPVVAFVGLALKVLNPRYNPGTVFFRQDRMGQHGQKFVMWKFRTMIESTDLSRDPNAPVEDGRITRLGRIMRRYRIDELPNFINVLKGEMSIIGPRPDAYNHADHFQGAVRGYKERHRVKPGITGLAQVEMGYAEGEDMTALKAKYDNMYVARSCGRLDVYVIRRTLQVIASGFGAR